MPRTLLRALALACLFVSACGGDGPAPVVPAAARSADPPRSDAAAPAGAPEQPVEISLTIPVGTGLDGEVLELEIRSVEARGRRHVTIDTPAGRVDQHVVIDDQHWWWIPPAARAAAGDLEWVHIDLTQVEAAGGELPDLVSDARTPLPAPGEIGEGTSVAGHRVIEVERVGPDEDRLTLAGLEGSARLRRRMLPTRTAIEPPSGAVELADLPELLPHLAPG